MRNPIINPTPTCNLVCNPRNIRLEIMTKFKTDMLRILILALLLYSLSYMMEYEAKKVAVDACEEGIP